MAALMMQKSYPGDATVTVCHSRSKDLVKECQEADIIIAALGQPNFVKADMVKEGAVIIDVGTTRVPDASKKSGFKLTGDVKYLKPGIKTFDKTIDSKAATTNGVKKIVDDAVICAGASTKGFAQSFIPVITYYKALSENGLY